MSPANQIVISTRHIIWISIAAFGGMITAMLATLAITVPVMSAQASSQLDQQAKQFAQVMSAQAQSATTKQAAAGFDLGSNPAACVDAEGGQGGGEQAKGSAGAAVAVAGVGHKVAHAKPTAVVEHKTKTPHAKVVSQKSTVNNSYNTVNDNDVYAVNSFNAVEVNNKGDNNKTNVGISNSVDVKTQADQKHDRKDHKGHEDRKDNKHHNQHKDHDNNNKKEDTKHDQKDDHKNDNKNEDKKSDHKSDDKSDHSDMSDRS